GVAGAVEVSDHVLDRHGREAQPIGNRHEAHVVGRAGDGVEVPGERSGTLDHDAVPVAGHGALDPLLEAFDDRRARQPDLILLAAGDLGMAPDEGAPPAADQERTRAAQPTARADDDLALLELELPLFGGENGGASQVLVTGHAPEHRECERIPNPAPWRGVAWGGQSTHRGLLVVALVARRSGADARRGERSQDRTASGHGSGRRWRGMPRPPGTLHVGPGTPWVRLPS